MDKLDEGKLSIAHLEKLVKLNGIKREAVLVGPKIGSDAAVLDFHKLERSLSSYWKCL